MKLNSSFKLYSIISEYTHIKQLVQNFATSGLMPAYVNCVVLGNGTLYLHNRRTLMGLMFWGITLQALVCCAQMVAIVQCHTCMWWSGYTAMSLTFEFGTQINSEAPLVQLGRNQGNIQRQAKLYANSIIISSPTAGYYMYTRVPITRVVQSPYRGGKWRGRGEGGGGRS